MKELEDEEEAEEKEEDDPEDSNDDSEDGDDGGGGFKSPEDEEEEEEDEEEEECDTSLHGWVKISGPPVHSPRHCHPRETDGAPTYRMVGVQSMVPHR
jgi:hypothetical protein